MTNNVSEPTTGQLSGTAYRLGAERQALCQTFLSEISTDQLKVWVKLGAKLHTGGTLAAVVVIPPARKA